MEKSILSQLEAIFFLYKTSDLIAFICCMYVKINFFYFSSYSHVY